MHHSFYHPLSTFLYTMYIICKWYALRFITNPYSKSTACLIGKTAIVTGGCMGIGYELAMLLASRGCRVIIADVADAENARQEIIEKTDNKRVFTKYLDLSSFEAIRKFAKDICENEEKIDILINNAATADPASSNDNFSKMVQVNFLGPFLLTHLLLEPLKTAPSARVIFTGSIIAHFSAMTLDNFKEHLNLLNEKMEPMKSWSLYGTSKLGNVFAAQEFARKLDKYGIKVNSYDPGCAKTFLTVSPYETYGDWWMGFIRFWKIIEFVLLLARASSFIAAQTGFHLASSKEVEDVTGDYYYQCRLFEKPLILKNQEFCKKLWDTLEEIVQLESDERL